MQQKIIVILGPTASGKSDLAVALAQKFDGEVISADSRQVYKGLDIGTGKITKTEMQGVPHHLLDVADPREQFTVSDFVKLAEVAIQEIKDENKLPMVCGGTGFYIDTLLGDKQIPEVLPNLKLRKELEQKSTEELFDILKELDPERASNIDSKNPRRLVRAIEICKVLGRVPKLVVSSQQSIDRRYEVLKIGIKVGEKELRDRINKRIEKWFEEGLLEEVENLHKNGLSWERMSEIGLEYKLVSQYLQNKINKEEMIERMQIETNQYAKRQRLWFKKDKNTLWINPKNVEEIEKEVEKFLD